jgi:hypothetical protein
MQAAIDNSRLTVFILKARQADTRCKYQRNRAIQAQSALLITQMGDAAMPPDMHYGLIRWDGVLHRASAPIDFTPPA